MTFREDIPEEQNHRGKHGIAICAASSLNPKELHIVSISGLESKTITIDRETRQLVIAVIYRPPSHSCTDFRTKLQLWLKRLPSNMPTVIMGDFNDNLVDTPITLLTELMKHHGFSQYVTKPTTDGGSLIDHIYFNQLVEDSNQIIIDTHDVYYSDHDSVFMSTNMV